MGKSVVVVTEQEYRKGESVFAEADGFDFVPVEAKHLVATVMEREPVGVIVGVEHYPADLYKALPKRSLIARFGVGYENIDIALANSREIILTNTPACLDRSVAENTISLILSAARKTCLLDRFMSKQCWLPEQGVSLLGKKLAVIGCGKIGAWVGRIASLAFGMRVVGTTEDEVDKDFMLESYGFDDITDDYYEAVLDADFVSLHLPGSSELYHYLDANKLDVLKPSTWIINTARGSIVDEAALYDALVDNAIAGAALDVFEHEPYLPVDPEKDLRDLSNVIMTPHISSNTDVACQKMAECCIKNFRLHAREAYHSMDMVNNEILSYLVNDSSADA